MSSIPASATRRSLSLDERDAGLKKAAELTGRVLLAAIFLISGLGKIGGYAGTAAYMSSVGVPAALLPLVIATEALGAIAIIIGWKTRIAAFLLAGFTLVAAVVFHSNSERPLCRRLFGGLLTQLPAWDKIGSSKRPNWRSFRQFRG